MIDIIKIVEYLKESGLLIKDVSKTIKNETKEQKGGFFGMLLGTLGSSLLRSLLTCKGTIRASEKFLMSPHTLTFKRLGEGQTDPPSLVVFSKMYLPERG